MRAVSSTGIDPGEEALSRTVWNRAGSVDIHRLHPVWGDRGREERHIKLVDPRSKGSRCWPLCSSLGMPGVTLRVD